MFNFLLYDEIQKISLNVRVYKISLPRKSKEK